MSELSGKAPKDQDQARSISIKEFKRLVKNYKDSTPNDDTQSAWFSVYDLLALISENKANGIRIYYGRHDKDHKSYPGRHNVILVATRDSTNPGDPCCENSHDQLNPAEDAHVLNPGSLAGMGFDMGPLCPPRCVPNIILDGDLSEK